MLREDSGLSSVGVFASISAMTRRNRRILTDPGQIDMCQQELARLQV